MYYYTEQEIKQWREERRKNYPSKRNVKKVFFFICNTNFPCSHQQNSVYLIVDFVFLQKLTEPDVKVKDAMLRRQVHPFMPRPITQIEHYEIRNQWQKRILDQNKTKGQTKEYCIRCSYIGSLNNKL